MNGSPILERHQIKSKNLGGGGDQYWALTLEHHQIKSQNWGVANKWGPTLQPLMD